MCHCYVPLEFNPSKLLDKQTDQEVFSSFDSVFYKTVFEDDIQINEELLCHTCNQSICQSWEAFLVKVVEPTVDFFPPAELCSFALILKDTDYYGYAVFFTTFAVT